MLRIPFLDSQCQFRSGYRFKPIWGDRRRRSNFANSKPQSQPQIPILNLKRKRDYVFLPELPANAKPHLDVGSDLDENPKPHKIKRLKIIPPKKPPHSCSVTPIWSSFDALVEVASLEIEKFEKFARLIQEKALKKPIFFQEKVKSAAVQKKPRFGHDDDQDWGLELETKKQRAMVMQEKWDMPKDTGNTSSTYALRTGWNNVRLSNDLKEGDLVQLWSFRVGQQACEDASSSTATNKGQLCFALVLL
ncbi:hypothetical protein SO802_029055 [Lithocarpus litseifolius]|uniref:TF-B3 domain-containing protein n=1 Tax=Lithocarpus litseifolius TaxID=425828 RepID=A0AAW2BS54_9ROSI